MQKLAPKQLLALIVTLTVGQTYAAAPSAARAAAPQSVGLAVAKSSIRVNTSTVTGNATLLSGNVVESVGGTSELHLRGGNVVMDTNARVQVFENRTELQSGKIQLQGSQLEAQSGQIRVVAAPGAEAILERKDSSVVVGSLRGAVRVVNREGVLLASLNPGNALAFDTLAMAAEEDQGGAGTGTPDKKSSSKKKKAGAAAGWGGLSAGAQTAVVLGVAAAVAVPTAVVTTRNNKSASSPR